MRNALPRSVAMAAAVPVIPLNQQDPPSSRSLPPGSVRLSRLAAAPSEVTTFGPAIRYVHRGEELCRIGGRTRRLAAGEFMLLRSPSTIETRPTGAEETVVLSVCLPEDTLLPGFERSIGATAIVGTAIDPLAALLAGYADALDSDPRNGPALAAEILRKVGRAAATSLADFAERLDRLTCRKRSTRVETLQRLERARSFMHAHAEGPVTLAEVAEEAALSRFHLSRTFAEVYGLPPLAYHRQLRLRAAAQLLKQPAASATQIAEQLGYGSLSAFTRAFRQNFGVPPSRSRRVA